MTRLINADDFIEEARNRLEMQDLYLPIHIKELVIDEMPTVDAEPVTRCKDCEYWRGIGKYCDYDMSGLDDDYCSWAKRKEK